jgi:predicted nicotinamide N-methyase
VAGYSTKHERVAIAGVEDLSIVSLRDRLQFFDPHGDAARLGISSAAWPLFGVTWPSGLYLATLLALRPVAPHERVLEIGCGLALASLVGHRRGADVTASDRHPLVETFLKGNLQANGLAPMKYRHGNWMPPPGAREDTSRTLTPELAGAFDLIIGSDVLYERDAAGDLARFIDRHSAPSVEVWIIDPNRGNRAAFSAQMARRGFSVSEDKIAYPAAHGAAAFQGKLLTYRRAAAE